MPIPVQTDVVDALEHGGRDMKCRAAIETAWATTKSEIPGWFRRKSSGRGIMWEHSVQAVINALAEDPGVKVVRHYDTVSFILDDKVLLRLKKANNQLSTKNYPTPLAGLFHRHERDLYGHEGHQRVELVHVFNTFQTELVWIGIVARDDKRRVLWEHELRSGGAEVLPLPTAPRPAPAADTVLRPTKPGTEKREKKEEE